MQYLSIVQIIDAISVKSRVVLKRFLYINFRFRSGYPDESRAMNNRHRRRGRPDRVFTDLSRIWRPL